MVLLKNIHEGFGLPTHEKEVNTTSVDNDSALTVGTYFYYHYGCNGFDDRGWGCGYRTLQTICSWILDEKGASDIFQSVPTIRVIQEILVGIQDKNPDFAGSKDWIGSLEVGYVINHLYDIDFRILHIDENTNWASCIRTLDQHFRSGGCPVMMGGKVDASSKCIVGTYKDTHLLIVDPHFYGHAKSSAQLQRLGWVKWYSSQDLSKGRSDFYNVCIPQIFRK